MMMDGVSVSPSSFFPLIPVAAGASPPTFSSSRAPSRLPPGGGGWRACGGVENGRAARLRPRFTRARAHRQHANTNTHL